MPKIFINLFDLNFWHMKDIPRPTGKGPSIPKAHINYTNYKKLINACAQQPKEVGTELQLIIGLLLNLKAKPQDLDKFKLQDIWPNDKPIKKIRLFRKKKTYGYLFLPSVIKKLKRWKKIKKLKLTDHVFSRSKQQVHYNFRHGSNQGNTSNCL